MNKIILSQTQKHRTTLLLVLLIAILIAGCATIGNDFPTEMVPTIKLNETTQQEIKDMFGNPWRVGIEDGMRTWTYGKYHYCLFGEASTQDLVLRFDDRGIVVSYSYNTTDLDE
ncbi:hypothetical protein JW877_03305 [bacterium]|nr:hypothetical protein [bacterium]